MGLFAALSFGAPWILTALIGLPVLWWLLKVTPPQPRRILFPPMRLLLGLKDEEQTPAHTPWWLLLLRLLAAALLIVALADPLLGRVVKILGDGPLVLVVDNGWAAAKNWEQRQTLIADLLHAAGDRPVAIVPTATPSPVTLLDAGAAGKIARELKPDVLARRPHDGGGRDRARPSGGATPDFLAQRRDRGRRGPGLAPRPRGPGHIARLHAGPARHGPVAAAS